MNKRLLIIFLLGFSSGLPLALVTSTLQAWFAASGMSVLATGMLSLIGLPYLYRVVLGPIVDRYTLCSLGKRRSWMLMTQLGLLISFNLMAWCSPINSPNVLAALAFLSALLAAIQDTAVDAQRVEYLPISEHGLGASLGVFGYRLALLIAGGLALVLAESVGWEITYRLMGSLMLVGVVATLISPEPSRPFVQKTSFLGAFTAPVKDLINRPYFAALISFIVFFKLGEAFTTTTSGIVMPFLIQGIHFSLATIGYVNKMLGLSSILLGGLVAGLLLLRYSLYQSLMLFGIIQALTNSLFVALAISGKSIWLLAIAVFCDNFASGMGSTALVALFMRIVDKQYTATQFSILVGISTLPRILSGPIAAIIQMHFGWVGLFQLSTIAALIFIPFLTRIKEQTVLNNQQRESVGSYDSAGPI